MKQLLDAMWAKEYSQRPNMAAILDFVSDATLVFDDEQHIQAALATDDDLWRGDPDKTTADEAALNVPLIEGTPS